VPATIDPYALIHKALRHQLTATLDGLARTDWSDPEATAASLDDLEVTLVTQEQHAHHEDAFYHPLLEERAPGCTQKFGQAHVALEARIGDIRTAADALRASSEPSPADAHALYLRYGQVFGLFLSHFDDEEIELHPLFRALCTDDDLRGLERQVVAANPPDAFATILPHFLAALGPGELIGWLGGLQAGMPPEVFGGVCATAAEVLDAPRWAAVSGALGIEAPAPSP
jgi:hypothetical protein